jgi:glutathione S-transferase
MTVLYGPDYSTFVRTARLALEEKGADYKLVPVDLLGGAHQQPDHLARHPFGKVPAFQHGDLRLFETEAITRYVNEAYAGPPLEPEDARGRALVTEAAGIIANYAYPAIIGQIFMQRAVMPMMGGTADEAIVQAALPLAKTSISVLERLASGHIHLASERLSRADLFLIPVYDYFGQIPEGRQMLAEAPALQRWWENVRTRPSVERTRPHLG